MIPLMRAAVLVLVVDSAASLDGCGGPDATSASDTLDASDSANSDSDVADAEDDFSGEQSPYEPFDMQPVAAWGRLHGLGGEGHELRDFSYPSGIALSKDESEIYVYDKGNLRIKVLDREGETIRTWPHPVASCVSAGDTIAVALDGTVLVSDSGQHEMVGYSPTGDEVFRWPIVNAGPFCGGTQHAHPLVVGPSGELYVAEINAGQIHQYIAPPCQVDPAGRLARLHRCSRYDLNAPGGRDAEATTG